MVLVYSADDLLHIIPGQVNGPQQSRDLLSRVSGYIDAAEKWVFSNVAHDSLFSELPDETLDTTRRLILIRALYNAVPALDLVLIPNGFGVVSTDSIAPASKDRVAALLLSLHSLFSDQLIILLKSLADSAAWRNSVLGRWWMASCLQPSVFISRDRDGFYAFSDIRPSLLEAEEYVESQLLGAELLDKIRLFSFTGISVDEGVQGRLFMLVAQQVQAYILALAKGYGRRSQLPDFLNVIRTNPEAFPEWHESDVAALFESQRFENVKDSPAFFF